MWRLLLAYYKLLHTYTKIKLTLAQNVSSISSNRLQFLETNIQDTI